MQADHKKKTSFITVQSYYLPVSLWALAVLLSQVVEESLGPQHQLWQALQHSSDHQGFPAMHPEGFVSGSQLVLFDCLMGKKMAKDLSSVRGQLSIRKALWPLGVQATNCLAHEIPTVFCQNDSLKCQPGRLVCLVDSVGRERWEVVNSQNHTQLMMPQIAKPKSQCL